MNKETQALVITMEECGELTQACSKVIRTDGLKENFLENLRDEIGDLALMIEVLKQYGFVTEEQIQERMEVKRNKLKKWSNIFD